MSKETYYFPHDCKARHDRKLINLIMKHGMSGVGVYWCLVEMLYEENGYLPLEYERITFELRIDTNVIQSVITDFELFENDGVRFWSNSILDRLRERLNKSEKAKSSINKRWKSLENNTNVLPSNNDGNTNVVLIKNNKEKKSKEKKTFVVPTVEEISSFCLERENNIDAQYFFNYQVARDWRLKGGQKIKDWRAVVMTWEKNDFNKSTDKKEAWER